MSNYARGGVMIAVGAGTGVLTFFTAKRAMTAWQKDEKMANKVVFTAIAGVAAILTISFLTKGVKLATTPPPTQEEARADKAISKQSSTRAALKATRTTARLNRRLDRKVRRGKLTTAQANEIRALA